MNKDYFLKRLGITHPSAFESYSYDFLPATFLAHDQIPIECRKHGVFSQKAYTHLQGRGCATCGALKSSSGRALTTDEFIANSQSKFGNRFDYHKTKYLRKDVALILTCRYHGDIVLTPDQHRWSKHGCLQCDFEVPRAIARKKVLQKAKELHKNKYDYSRVVFVNVSDKVEILCPIHGSFWQSLYDHTTRGAGCPTCAGEGNKFYLKDFVAKASAVHGNQYDYSKVQYETNTSMVTITCPKHGDFIQRAASHLAGCKCKKCKTEETRLSTDTFVHNARLIHEDRYDYSKVVYHSNKKPVEIVCPIHGSFWQQPNNHISSRCGCRACMESKGEKAVELFLKKYGIDHIREYRILPYRYRYDFYLPVLNVYIEYNGLQHYRPVEFFGGQEGYLSMKKRDEIKKILIKEKNGTLIVVTHICSTNEAVEKELIRRLKKIMVRWYLINGKLMVFKTLNEVYVFFNIPLTVLIQRLDCEVKKVVKDFSVLF